ncbi:MAG TPA: multicopper oxidase domain-containing protein [Candidatus Bathyarchaeia archaeon]|nr:multicopper oxidase domain-containing protein [Candidatus Bathyarchaeia archaeon]
MIRKRYIGITVVAVLVLAGILTQATGSAYNPRLDYNNDGVIDIQDLFALAQGYGTSPAAYTPRTLNLTLTVQGVTIEAVPGNNFNLWSYNGTVPGPTIWANVGDSLHITLRNQHSFIHSLHVHGISYNITSDGSEGDPGYSDRGMVATNQQYTYHYKAERPGVFVYHCHSDDRYPISVHMQQGLYGIIVVKAPSMPLPTPDREYAVFLNEVYGQLSLSMAHGCAYCFGQSKFFTINTRQLPLTPTLTALPGELVRLYVINVGNDIHSFHLHGHAMYRWEIINNQWASVLITNDNLGFVPLESAIIDVTAQTPGKWLYHCHVEPHADLGMMGVFEIQGQRPLQSSEVYGPPNLMSKFDPDYALQDAPASSTSDWCSQNAECPKDLECPHPSECPSCPEM